MHPRFLLAGAACALLLCVHPAAAQTDTTASRPAAAPADTAPLHAPAPAPRRVHHDRLRISEEEIQEHPEPTAYALILALRPAWLRSDQTAQTGAGTGPIVRVDGQPVGFFDELKRIRVENLKELQFLPANDAVQMFGRDYNAGAIIVTLR
jgi:hypothetical protein